MLIGYGRIGFERQGRDQQTQLLADAGCGKIFFDEAAFNDKKPALTQALAVLQTGDCLIVSALNIIGRKMVELKELIHALTSKNITFISIAEDINCTADNHIFLANLTSLVEMENSLLKEQTSINQALARQNGARSGRKRQMTNGKIEVARTLFAQGMTSPKVAKYLGVSISTLYRWCPARERI